MRFLFAFTHVHIWLPLDPVARRLCEQGHQVCVLFEQEWNRKFVDQFPLDPSGQPYEIGWLTPRTDRWAGRLQTAREFYSYLCYLRRKDTSPVLTERWRS